MPEGDTLRHAEQRVAPLLEGRTLTTAWFAKLAGHRPREGMTVERVRAVGKHLLIELDRRLTLDTHLGMAGWWDTIGPDRPLPRSPRLRVVLGVAEGHALCFAAPTIRTFLRDDDTPTGPLAVGPDLSDAAPDFAAVLAAIDQLHPPTATIADVLLDQRVAAGVGNVYKSEACFVAGVDPRTPIGALDTAARERLWRLAHRLLRANLTPGPRRTTPGGGDLFVYGRARQACRRCDGTIVWEPAGTGATSRSTYWCPHCQVRPG